MGAIEQLLAKGIRLELQPDNNIRATGRLDDSLRASIRAQKQVLVTELQWRAFEHLLAVVGPAFRTPAHEYAEIREAAKRDLTGALSAYQAMIRKLESAS